ncbi:MAG TPA: hypothetical protein P5567_10070 [Kiritimatiellia bacterium]|nr:hypothetical protein [Kiritimatiellia bacterium]HRZ12786.1 hypothetical protein [Kiritimatiellia bacterium]HSA18262.1 hypothetical protein [Kiritimatiellia bacterium]
MKRSITWGVVVVLAWLGSSLSAMAQSPLRLVFAAPIEGAAGGVSWSYSDIYVHVDSMDGLGGSWGAVVHHDGGAGGSWIDTPMSLVGHYGTHMLFYARVPRARMRFAIRATWSYAVSGMTTTRDYWDNNGGADYSVIVQGGAVDGIVGGNVGLVVASNYCRTVSGLPAIPRLCNQYVAGTLVVQSTAPSVVAGIRVTTDNWRHFTDIPVSSAASYGFGYGSAQVRVCRFEQRIGTRMTKPNRTAKFAVYFRDALGREFWDNNFEQDYTVRAGGTIR